MIILGIVSGVALCLYAFRKWRELQWGVCRSRAKMGGKVIIITGSNSGIGKETARELAERGATVILACRSETNAKEAIRDIRCTTGNGDLVFSELDLSDLDSVRKCASDILEKFSQIDVLVNNAGVYFPCEDNTLTKDGFEAHFGINHLGHFLFTNLLLDRIKRTENSRIVIVSSMLHKTGQIDFETLGSSASFSAGSKRKARNPLYCDSKLCNILHGLELRKKLIGTTTGVHVLCPGFVYTGLFRYSLPKYNWIKKLCLLPIAFFFMRGPKKGAQTSVYCAVSEKLQGVPYGFYRDCKGAEVATPLATDEELASKLWSFSQALIDEKSQN